MNNLFAKIAGFVAAIALFVGVAVPAASALTSAEITALLIGAGVDANTAAVLAAALGEDSTTTTTTTGSGDLCTVAAQTSFSMGTTGASVVALQNVLISNGYLNIPAGVSKGYFGSLTKSALAQYQVNMMGVAGATGWYGPISQNHFADKCQAAGSTTTTTTTTTGGSVVLNGGDGDFDEFDILGDPSGESVEEGEDKAVIGFEFEADDSDLRVERIDFTLEGDGQEKPWKYLESISLYRGDDKVADIDASDRDEWDEIGSTDEYEATFSGLDEVVEEGDMEEFYIYVETVNSNDDLPITWTITIPRDGIRAMNAAGISVYAPNGDETETFDQEVAEAGDLDISVDEDDNEDRVVTVDADTDTDDVLLYFATIESDTGDNMIEDFSFDVTGSSSTIANVASTFKLLIDGDEVASESTSGMTVSGTVTFDNVDYEIEEGDEVDVEITVDVRDTDDNDNFFSGETLQVTGISIDYVDEQDDDITINDTTDGGVITLSVDSIMVEVSATPSSVYPGQTLTKGKYVVKFEVTAPEDDDIYIALASATTSYEIVDASTGATTTATTTSASFTGGTITSNHIKISDGQSQVITMTVNLDNLGGATDKDLQVGLSQVSFKVGSTVASAETYTSGLDEDYRTDSLILYNSAQN